MRPTTVVSSANLMKRLDLFDGVQSWVSRVKRRGLSTHPWGGPCVQCDGAGCVTADPYCLRSPGQKAQQPVAQRRIEPQLDQFMNELLRDDCVECWTEVYEQHSDIWVFFVQMCEGWVEGQWRWHHRSSGWTYMQLEGVQGGGGGQTWCGAWLTVQSTSW